MRDYKSLITAPFPEDWRLLQNKSEIEPMALESIEDYYDLDDILATNEKIPCKIQMPIYRLGKYDGKYEMTGLKWHIFSRCQNLLYSLNLLLQTNIISLILHKCLFSVDRRSLENMYCIWSRSIWPVLPYSNFWKLMTDILFFYLTGYLDSSSTSEHLNPGTKIELPYWMARSLCSRKRHMVSVELPKYYRYIYRPKNYQ